MEVSTTTVGDAFTALGLAESLAEHYQWNASVLRQLIEIISHHDPETPLSALHVLTDGQHVVQRRPLAAGDRYIFSDYDDDGIPIRWGVSIPLAEDANGIGLSEWVVVRSAGCV